MRHINATNRAPINCCGCSACQQVCPTDCIVMVPDEEGFLYPRVNDNKCNDCGLCSSTCAWIKQDVMSKSKSSPAVYAAKSKDDGIRLKSASGGLFSVFAAHTINQGGIVYGAAFCPRTQSVEHIGETLLVGLDRLRCSKYVQSCQGNVFREIRSHLKNGLRVLYIGTPCQCEGLRQFLKKDYETLVIIDILCHSVPSPRVFNDLLQRMGGDVRDISFRNKNLGWRNSYQFRLFRGDEIIINDTYLTMFFKGLISRPSCYHCKFTTTIRSGDISIGDYWNINSTIPEFEDPLGVSCLLVNTSNGESLFENIKNSIHYVETNLTPALQPCMVRHVKEPKDRNRFWSDYAKYGLLYCETKYGRMTKWEVFRDRTLAPFIRKIRSLL